MHKVILESQSSSLLARSPFAPECNKSFVRLFHSSQPVHMKQQWQTSPSFASEEQDK